MFKFLTFLWRPALPSPSLTTTSAASVPQHIPRSHTTAHAAYLHTKMLMLSPCYPLAHERLYQPALLFCLQIFSRFLLHYKAYQIWTPQGSCWCAGPLHLTLICLILVQHPGDLPGFLIDGELFGVRAILCLWLEHPVITGACREVYKFNSKKRKLLGFKAEQYVLVFGIYILWYTGDQTRRVPSRQELFVSSAWEIIKWDYFFFLL